MIYAIIKNNIVENLIIWDGVSAWEPPDGTFVVECSEYIQIGFSYLNGVFVPPESSSETPS